MLMCVQGLLAMHCCAMQGRMDVMQLMRQYDPKDTIVATLNSEEDRSPPSLLHLAIANDFIDCAQWLVLLHSSFLLVTNTQIGLLCVWVCLYSANLAVITPWGDVTRCHFLKYHC